MLLIPTNLKEDENAQAVAAKLRGRGAEYLVFDYAGSLAVVTWRDNLFASS